MGDLVTDARFPDRWLHDLRVQTLPHHAFRLFVIALTWSASNRTDGEIDRQHLRLLPCSAGQDSVDVLVRAKLWTERTTGYTIADFQTTQTSAAQLAAYERKTFQDRERQARKRARDRGESDRPRRDSLRDVAATSKDRTETGEARSRTSSERSSTDHYSGSDADSLYPSSGISDDDWDSEWAHEAS
ncbi:hypothetical protein [Pseudonocardia sediminis]|uniref:hypothetical protein n=1 Tax=Pseudonocardia sediminis TaxID=1397368 RepID=UPI00102900F3|nr:hypothetical protein [Pseudonocardia sediminis]